MIYTKIRIDFKYGPKERFYRVILVKEDINLFNLGVGLGLALGAEFEHCIIYLGCSSGIIFSKKLYFLFMSFNIKKKFPLPM